MKMCGVTVMLYLLPHVWKPLVTLTSYCEIIYAYLLYICYDYVKYAMTVTLCYFYIIFSLEMST